MAHDLAIVSKIESLTPIEGKDRIVMARIENYNSIVAKEDFKVGDTAIYVFYDSILPAKPEYEFLRKRCWSEKYQGFRIRPMKMGDAVSEGLVLPMSYLPKDKSYKLGDIVTDDLGIRLYDPEAEALKANPPKHNKFVTFMCRYAWFRKFVMGYDKKKAKSAYYPNWISKSDEENIEKCYDNVKDIDENFILTEKIEGQASVFAIDKGKFKIFSHNWRVNDGVWVDYAKNTGLEQKLKNYCKKNKLKSFAISGEMISANAQKNIYGVSNPKLFLYGGFHADGTCLAWTELCSVARELEIPVVPLLGRSKIYDLDEMLKDCEGYSVLENTMTKKPVPREGVVWRTESGNCSFKCKSRSYKIFFEEKK